MRMFSAGRFDQRHGLERVFNGLASNAAKERFELHLVGEGPELENYKKLHNDLNLQKHVHFYGRISEEKLRELEAHFGERLEGKVTVDPTLIGGVRVTIGDRVFDASVRGKLDLMAAALKN